ncbi:MAG: hypothetical protein LBG44_08010 [Gemmatimonadota bacterium]|jgi:hypothetical protein|nr:hypothetical protein [Gemmatimonadota bacterium]
MKADTYARFVVLETLVEAETGYLLSERPTFREDFREGFANRISGLIAEIDSLDQAVARRAWDATVDFFAVLPEDEEGIEAAALSFRRILNRIMERGLDRHDLADPSVWAVVLETLLRALTDEYRTAYPAEGRRLLPRERERVEGFLNAARHAADRMLWNAGSMDASLSEALIRLHHAILHRQLPPAEVDAIRRLVVRRVARYRPSTLSRVGVFVIRQLLAGGRERLKSNRRAGRKKVRKAGEPRGVRRPHGAGEEGGG